MSTNPGATSLQFDVLLVSVGTVGFWGPDELVVSVLDPITLDPLFSGLNGVGGVVRYRGADGIEVSEEVSAHVVSNPPVAVCQSVTVPANDDCIGPVDGDRTRPGGVAGRGYIGNLG